ncbi:RusA family crossover junction endodeoxyribonuclease [Ramlibacter sp. MMS24-I3-19]|uniref:RusA family crossover junction endodeoxyribonuclease n=1 Tax=Ramlibacter sp. MMS24-I3-19 TaxID=3416606 RepID=UPI003CFD152B
MTIPVEFLVHGRPSSVNATSAKKKVWKTAVNAAAASALGSSPPPPHAGEVTVKFFFFPTSRQYTDVDNGIKHTLDAISPPVLQNDKTVMRVVAERFVPEPGSSLIVPVGIAPILANALMSASGQSAFLAGAGKPQYATAIKVVPYTEKSGEHW